MYKFFTALEAFFWKKHFFLDFFCFFLFEKLSFFTRGGAYSPFSGNHCIFFVTIYRDGQNYFTPFPNELFFRGLPSEFGVGYFPCKTLSTRFCLEIFDFSKRFYAKEFRTFEFRGVKPSWCFLVGGSPGTLLTGRALFAKVGGGGSACRALFFSDLV